MYLKQLGDKDDKSDSTFGVGEEALRKFSKEDTAYSKSWKSSSVMLNGNTYPKW